MLRVSIKITKARKFSLTTEIHFQVDSSLGYVRYLSTKLVPSLNAHGHEEYLLNPSDINTSVGVMPVW